MNFLAHLVLAGITSADRPPPPDEPRSAATANAPVLLTFPAFAEPVAPLLLVGNLLPDLARDLPGYRGARAQTHPDLPPAVRAGIARHRLVDRITDTHPAFLRTRARLTPTFGRFAGVIADLLFDHALSIRWDAAARSPRSVNAGFSPIPRPAFIAAVHAALQFAQAQAAMPESMRRTADAMIRHAWLERYASAPGLEQTLAELSYRFTNRYQRPVHLLGITTHLTQHCDALLADFDELWPFLIARIVASD